MTTAVEHLKRARALHLTSRYAEMLGALDEAARALEGCPADDPLWLDVQVARVSPLRVTGELTLATEIAQAAVRATDRRPPDARRAQALAALGYCFVQAADHAGAAALASQALEVARQVGEAPDEVYAGHLLAYATVAQGRPLDADPIYAETTAVARAAGLDLELSKLLASHAQLRMDLGDQPGGELLAREAVAAAARVDNPFARVKAEQALAGWCLRAGQAIEALARFRTIEALARQIDDLQGVALALNGQGEALRQTHAPELAARCYREARAIAEAIGANPVLYRLNMAVVATERGAWDEAVAEAEAIATRVSGAFGAIASALALAANTARGELDAADRWEPRVRRQLDQMQLSEPDVARLLELGAMAAAERPGAETRLLTLAARCLALALPMWTRLSAESDRARVEERLRALASRGARIPLGPFDLIRPLGAGGMGEVWQGEHRAEGLPVAIKVIALRVASERTRAALRAEVRVVARLNHPNIVRIHDYGPVSAAAEIMTDGRLVSGSPYLSMALGSGSLLERCGRTPWVEARSMLSALLDALAHAHARGLVHLDIKPDNVLVGRGFAEVSLTDFGLARAVGEAEGAVAGTPAYMAPEHIRGDWRNIGPWTDLYAFGCLAWALLTGGPPFGAGEPSRVMERQLFDELPSFYPTFAVPEGTLDWLARLMGKSIDGRFRRAADAAQALAALDEAGGPVGPWPAPNLDELADARWDSGATLFFEPSLEPEPAPTPGSTRPTPRRAPIPERWQGEREAPVAEALLGAGLQTFGLREVPLVGREAERDALWGALRATPPRVVVLRGAAGVGKTRLAEWLAFRAHETGAGTPLRLRGGDVMDDEARLLVQPGTRDGDARAAATATAIHALVQERAVVLWVDDAHADAASLDLLARLLGASDPCPLVAVVCARDDLLAEAAVTRAQLERLDRLACVTTVPVLPLPDAELRRLVRSVLRLDGTLLEQLSRRAMGNPMFALELMGDWVGRGLLVPGDEGFRLRETAGASLPDSVHEVWTRRLDAALEELGENALLSLEIAAVLGLTVCETEWFDGCRAAALVMPSGLAERLQDARLFERAGDRWRFSNGMVRESLLRRAEEAGRLVRWHGLCVDVLRARDAEPARIGQHLAFAGRYAEAVGPLLAAVASAVDLTDAYDALVLLDLTEQTLESAGVAADDPRRVEAWLWRATTCQKLGRTDEALGISIQAAEVSRRAGRPAQLAWAGRIRAAILRMRGQLHEAASAMREVVELTESIGDAEALSRALHGLALTTRSLGDTVTAHGIMLRAIQEAQRSNETRLIASNLCALGAIEIQLDRHADARAHMEEALRLARASGSTGDIAISLNGLAELDRKSGDLDSAERRYLEAIQVHRVAGLALAIFPRLNLSLVLLARRRWSEAREGLQRVLAELHRQGRDGLAGAVHVMLLAPSLGLDDLPAFDQHLAEGRRLLERTGHGEPDTAWAAELAAGLARERGDITRARAAEAIALQQRAPR